MTAYFVRRPSKIPGLRYTIWPPKARLQYLSVDHVPSGKPVFRFPHEVHRTGEAMKVIDRLLADQTDWSNVAPPDRQVELALRRLESCFERVEDAKLSPFAFWRVKARCRR